MSASSTLFLLVAVVGVMTAAGYVHYQRTQTQMRDQVCGVCVACCGYSSKYVLWCLAAMCVCACVFVGVYGRMKRLTTVSNEQERRERMKNELMNE